MNVGAEVKYARSEATRSINSWAEGFTVSPTTNIVAIVNDVRNTLQGVGQSNPHIRGAVAEITRRLSSLFSRHLQESGKPDLFVCLPAKGGIPVALAVEVKGFYGALKRKTLRENQLQWAEKTTWGAAYWIFLWGYEDDTPPQSFSTRAARDKRHAYLIPLSHWIAKWNEIERLANVGTLHYYNGSHSRKALREHDITVGTAFGAFELKRKGSYWVLPQEHPLARVLA